MGEELGEKAGLDFVSTNTAPASEGGLYKGKPRSTVRSDCATGTAPGGVLVLRCGYNHKSGGKPPHSKLRGGV